MGIRFAKTIGFGCALLAGTSAHAFSILDSHASDGQWWNETGSQVGSDKLYKYGEQWWDQKWGARGALYHRDTTGLDFENNKHLAVDVKRRLFSMSGNSYLAVGLGWDDIELPGDTYTTGMRFVAEGRYDVFKRAYFFGQAAYTPWLSEVEDMAGPNGRELEVGLAVNPFPSMSLKAGYRNYWLDSGNTDDDSLYSSGNNGVFIGGGLSW